MKKVTKEQYSEMVKQTSPGTPILKNSFLAFLFGGFVCTTGQLICNIFINCGFTEKESRAIVSLTLITISALMTMIGIYDKLAQHVGAGLLVPITGFANSMVASAMEYRSEGYVLGVGAKLFTVAGPVIVYGVFSSMIYGVIILIMRLF